MHFFSSRIQLLWLYRFWEKWKRVNGLRWAKRHEVGKEDQDPVLVCYTFYRICCDEPRPAGPPARRARRTDSLMRRSHQCSSTACPPAVGWQPGRITLQTYFMPLLLFCAWKSRTGSEKLFWNSSNVPSWLSYVTAPSPNLFPRLCGCVTSV